MLTLFNLKKKTTENYDYEDIYEGMKDGERNYFLKQLYERSMAGEIHAYCTCIEDKQIPLIVSKHKNTYYIKRQDASVEHSSTCKFDGEYVHSLKGWEVNSNGSINVSLKDRMHSLKSFYNPNLAKNQITLKDFTARYMGFVWELQTKYFLKNNKGKVTLNDYCSGLQYWARKIHLSERVTLKDIMGISKTKSYSLLKDNLRMYILLMFEKKEKLDKNNIKVYLKNPNMNFSVEVTCPIEMWNKATEDNPVKKAPFVVSGFVELSKDKPLSFVDLCVVSVSNEGAIVNSEYERKLINHLHKRNRHFINTYETVKSFEQMRPNIVLLDTAPYTLIEIFDKPKEDMQYYDEKEKKLRLYNSLDKYKIIIWDAFNDEKLYKF